MNRREWFEQMIALAGITVSTGTGAAAAAAQSRGTDREIQKIEKSRSEWRKLLTPEQYRVLFEEDTEPAFSHPLDKEKRAGTYICAACYLPLFSSKAKFESGTGWPSFFEPIPGRVATKRDFKLIFPRTEYHCVRCGGHQGHLFDDGPPPTRQRWCNNGLALKFVPAGESLPPLRT
jgi:peptide-methionine (R)-S-oxide reductase